MLSYEKVQILKKRLEGLSCVNPKVGDGLFTYVFNGELEKDAQRYKSHLAKCEFCRIARQIYRRKRDVAKLISKTRPKRRYRVRH